eukprot:3569312-Amphidinium_carterae.1
MGVSGLVTRFGSSRCLALWSRYPKKHYIKGLMTVFNTRSGPAPKASLRTQKPLRANNPLHGDKQRTVPANMITDRFISSGKSMFINYRYRIPRTSLFPT